jgi:hypothetical protein
MPPRNLPAVSRLEAPVYPQPPRSRCYTPKHVFRQSAVRLAFTANFQQSRSSPPEQENRISRSVNPRQKPVRETFRRLTTGRRCRERVGRISTEGGLRRTARPTPPSPHNRLGRRTEFSEIPGLDPAALSSRGHFYNTGRGHIKQSGPTSPV